MYGSKKAPSLPKPLTTTITPSPRTQPQQQPVLPSPYVDYRSLIHRSRYDQIESELSKLADRLTALEEEKDRRRSQAKSRSKSSDTEAIEDDQEDGGVNRRRLSQALVNIEDDLHRILYILLHQYEQTSRRRGHRLAKTQEKSLMIQGPEAKETPPSTTPQRRTSTQQTQTINQQSLRSRALSQPNLYHQTDDQLLAQERPPSTVHFGDDSVLSRSRSNERRRSSPTKLTSTTADSQLHHCHYRVTKPDVQFILGTSPNPSHSMIARRQLKLAALKQHGPLCLKGYTTPTIEYTDGPEERSRIIQRVQGMINELQLEYDRLYRKLQFETTFETGEAGSSLEIPRISGHLVHIMDQLVDLHQLNKSVLSWDR